MSVFGFTNKDTEKNNITIDSLIKIRNENPDLRQKFIEDNAAFILKNISKALGKSVVTKNSEEFNIGLSAFNYSIDNFDLKSSEEDFFTYSEKIIKKHLYDYSLQSFKSVKKQTSPYYNEENSNPYENIEDLEEIALFKQSLWKFGITLKELSLATPNHTKTVKSLMNVAKYISRSDELFLRLNSSRNVPMDGLDDDLKLQKAFIKKYKDYIFALCLIMRSNLEVLKSFIKNYEMELDLYKNTGIVLELSDGMAIVFTDKCRFAVIKNSNHLSVGYKVKSRILNKQSDSIVKYSIMAAVFSLVVFSLLVSFKNLDLTGSPDTPVQNGKQVVVNSPKKENNNKTNTSKKTDTGNSNKTVAAEKNIPAKAVPTENNENITNEVPVPTYKNTLAHENTPVPTKSFSTPVYPAVGGSIRTIPPVLPTATKEIKPTPRMGSVFYPTVKATGAPSKPRISSDLYEVKVGEDYTITMNTFGGNNGTKWKLYENDMVISTMHCEDKTPNDQKMARLITPKKSGTYTYRCELINDFGTSASTSIEIVVK